MSELDSAEDAEPSHRTPTGTLFVPVRSGSEGFCVRLFRMPLGGRTAVAFTSPRLLAATLGDDQRWIRLAEPALRALAEPLGATALTVDPQLVAPRPSPVVPRPAVAPVARTTEPAPPAAPHASLRGAEVAGGPGGPLNATNSRAAGRILLVGQPGRAV